MAALEGLVEVGAVLSGATASLVPFVLRRDRELEVRDEDLAVVVDPRVEGYYLLGTVRRVVRYEPLLRRSVHSIYAERPDALDESLVMPFTNAYLEVYAGLCGSEAGEAARSLCDSETGMVANTYAPTPGSRVYRVRRGSWLDQYIRVEHGISVGVHKYSGWRLPLEAKWASYHIGVFGATGTGKSRLVSVLVSRLRAAGYGVIVFDHSGVDYAPRFRDAAIPSRRLVIDPAIFASTVSRYLQGLSQNARDLVESVAMCLAARVYKENGVPGGEEHEACREILGEVPGPRQHGGGRARRGQASLFAAIQPAATGSEGEQPRAKGSLKERFLLHLQAAASLFGVRDATLNRLRLMVEFLVPRELFEGLQARRTRPLDLVEEARGGGLVVVDMSDERDIEVKRAIIASVASAAWSLVAEEGRPLGLGLVVDEAQNYACEHCGASSRALETVAREGRKWRLFIVVASQRVSRDVKPGIRGNLGTVFFSRLQSTGDLQELRGYLDLGGVDEAGLAMLGRREFYVAGLMNPLRRPLLLKVDEAEKAADPGG